ncbi:hypothetical protein DMTZ50_1141 [Dehalococcoides mccartyi]|uniref:Uncharacterized protein n=1 Tax=Dehalococcoides mccartyi TaxID=61435 RepID=A0A142VA82_9CHLR|nr:hypothetical protein Dm11a5_0918 [Dehalococcoides mccartyi]AOV99512.1 hypothetical protein DCWBC2_0880 [Dehalococcoides mccartyi]MBA2085312.1 hypothetical protein [Dehalococcoides mccartyi]
MADAAVFQNVPNLSLGYDILLTSPKNALEGKNSGTRSRIYR